VGGAEEAGGSGSEDKDVGLGHGFCIHSMVGGAGETFASANDDPPIATR
jgi:hypothetical protein